MLLIEPIVWIFYYVLLLVPLAWLLATKPTETKPTDNNGRIRWWWLLGVIGYFIATVVFPLDPRTAAPMSIAYVLGICAHPVGLALVWIAHAGCRFGGQPDYLPSADDTREMKASGTMMPRATS